MNIRHLLPALLSFLPLHAIQDNALPPTPVLTRLPQSEKNPLLEISKPVQWSRLTPDQIHADIDMAIERYLSRIRTIETVENPSYEKTFSILMYNAILMDAFYRAEVLIRGHDSPEHRKLAAELDKKYNEAKSKLFHNERIWATIKKMVTPSWLRRQWIGRHNFVAECMAEFRNNGADLPPDLKVQFTASENELSTLKRQFAANLADARAEWKFDITDYKILDKLPAEYIKQENGRRFLRYHIAESLLSICPDEKLREALWRSLETIGKGPHDNSALILRMISIRQKQAEMLGYANHADRIAARCTMNTGAQAAEYIRNNLQLLRPAYVRNMQLLQDIKARHTENPQAELAPWDIPYYSYLFSSIYLQHLTDIDKLLTGDMILRRIFDRLSSIYGITFSERSTVYLEPGSNKKAPDGMVEVWHPSVRYFEIIDTIDCTQRGAIYLDLEFRENKENGIWAIPITSYEFSMQKVHCAIISSTHGIQALMYPAGIQDMLHELGHTLHWFMDSVEENNLGFQPASTDFIEFASTLHADLSKQRDVLVSLLQPALSDDAYLDYIHVRDYQDIQNRFHMLCTSLLDLEIHMQGGRHATRNLDALENEILHDYLYINTKGDNLSEYIPYCRNAFIFSGRYSGLLYSYCLGEDLAADARSRFFTQSMHFRQTFLRQGNIKPAKELYRDFMGSPPRFDAFQRNLDLGCDKNEAPSRSPQPD